MVVYKFKAVRSSEEKRRVVDMLKEPRCFMARWQDLNDPMEGYFRYYENHLGDSVSESKKQFRVCSFSRYFSNSLLWSYYADGFSGVCVAVEIEDKFLKPVVYEDDIPEFEDFGDKTPDEMAIIALTRKLSYWRHEAEVRAIAPLAALSEGEFIKCDVKGVLFGPKVDPVFKGTVERLSVLGFQTDTVRLNAGMPAHQCDGATTGVRPENLPLQDWLHQGAGPLSGWTHPAGACQVCGEPNPHKLEMHFIDPLHEGGLPSPMNTGLLCANCHKIEHIFDENRTTLLNANLRNNG